MSCGSLSCGLFEEKVCSSLQQANCHQLGVPQMSAAAMIPLTSSRPPWLDLSYQLIVGATIPISQDIPSDQAIVGVVGESALFPSYPQCSWSPGKKNLDSSEASAAG